MPTNRPRGLRVYRWTSFRNVGQVGRGQTVEIVAAESMAEVRRLLGVHKHAVEPEFTITSNANEVLTAMEAPGTVFYRQIDDYRDGAWVMVRDVKAQDTITELAVLAGSIRKQALRPGVNAGNVVYARARAFFLNRMNRDPSSAEALQLAKAVGLDGMPSSAQKRGA